MSFNADMFMQTEITETGDTEYTPIPEGEYTGVIKEIKAGVTPKGSPFMEVMWIVDNQEARDLTGQDEPTCRQSVWLDVDDAGNLAFGANKNIQLNRLRAALGQNDGRPWAPGMMVGNTATIDIKHRILDDGRVMADVKGVRA